MIDTTSSKNKSWGIGDTVKVGFMNLRVLEIKAIKDHLPDIYVLESLDGTKKYEFIPHRGLKKIEPKIKLSWNCKNRLN